MKTKSLQLACVPLTDCLSVIVNVFSITHSQALPMPCLLTRVLKNKLVYLESVLLFKVDDGDHGAGEMHTRVQEFDET